MTPADFVHLHCHSEYSMLDGASRISAMVRHAKELGQPALALTDHGVMFGAYEFQATCVANGIKPIIGCELYITTGHRSERTSASREATHHQLLLAMDYEGYLNIGRMSSIGHIEGYYYHPRIDFEVLEKYSRGVIATSSCMSGVIPELLREGKEARAEEYLERFLAIFGRERFYIELQDHGIPEQKELNRKLLELGRKHRLKAIATNDCHYTRRQDARTHDLLLCIQTGATLKDESRMKFDTEEFYIKSTEEMAKTFDGLPEAITNTREIADLCNFRMPEKKYHLPRFPTPGGISEEQHLRDLVAKGSAELYGTRVETDTVLRERIAFELDVIERMGFAAYFLIVADFIAHARSIGIPVGPGRGSAAGSVVAYSLGITQLDPLEHGLLFERFLNPDRVSMPDIDVDFCFERRPEVIEYVRQKYGRDCVAQIITFGTLKAKLAVRDVGRAMGLDLKAVDRVARLIPDGPSVTLRSALAESQDLKALIESDPDVAKLVETALSVEGTVRHPGIHAAGVVIADRPLTDYCPLYKSPKDNVVATQFNMGQVEEIGLLKMDFLGIKNLTIIQRVENWLREREGVTIDWSKVPLDDARTYEGLHKGHTGGVFQLESAGMTALVKAMKPSNFADLTALIALYRPGPLQAGMHTEYVERKHGRREVSFDHPKLAPILGETFGIILYQEQVMRIAMELCGFTRGDADVLRKAMGKKKADVMQKMEEKFVSGAGRHSGVDAALARHIWDQIVTFAGYGFNKSHSAAYAVITFRTAYLRAHWPVHFMAALLTNELSGGGTEGIAKYMAECREVGIEVRPLDINFSRDYFNPVDGAIYYALNGVKGVGGALTQAVLAERDRGGKFASLEDFLMRMPPAALNPRMMEALVKVGAFDSLHRNRHQLFASLTELLNTAAAAQREIAGGQESLFGGEPVSARFDMRKVPDWDSKARANFEKEFLGFYLADHPLSKYRLEIDSFVSHTAPRLKELAETLSGDETRSGIRTLGVVTNIATRPDRNGKAWAIVTLEDMEGQFEAKFFSRIWEQVRDKVHLERVISIEGRLSVWNGRASYEGFEVRSAEELRELGRMIELRWPAGSVDAEGLRALRELCARRGGRRAIQIVVTVAGERHSVVFHPNGPCRIDLTDESIADLQALPGRPKVRLVP
jgi:DNA polymerase-3 subunit alpha